MDLEKQITSDISFQLGLLQGKHGMLFDQYPSNFNKIISELGKALVKAGYRKVSDVLSDEERMRVYIPCEIKCSRDMPLFDCNCMDCIAIEHEKAQRDKDKGVTE